MADFHGGTRGWFGKQELCHLSCMLKSYVIDSVDLFAERAQPFASLYPNLIQRLGNFLKVRALAFKTSSHSPYGARLSSCKFVLRRAALCVTCGFVGTCPMYWLYLMVRRELRMGIHFFPIFYRRPNHMLSLFVFPLLCTMYLKIHLSVLIGSTGRKR